MNGSSCFVILHYGENVKITMDAVAAIRRLQKSEQADIIIVCNGAQYDIRNKVDLCDLGDINVVVLPENVGFSAGNNIGYIYAKEHGEYDFVVVMNNDVIIKQTDFLERLQKIYRKHPFYVCGPDIYTPAIAYHSSPINRDILTLSDLDAVIRNREEQNRQLSSKLSLFSLKSYLIEAFYGRSVLSSIFKIWRMIKRNDNGYEREQSDVVLQGSCLIFSKDYIHQNEKAFVPEVFLYFEEYYLTQRCRRNGWEILYSPEISVIHNHRGSSGLRGQRYYAYCDKRKAINMRFIAAAKEAKTILHGSVVER